MYRIAIYGYSNFIINNKIVNGRAVFYMGIETSLLRLLMFEQFSPVPLCPTGGSNLYYDWIIHKDHFLLYLPALEWVRRLHVKNAPGINHYQRQRKEGNEIVKEKSLLSDSMTVQLSNIPWSYSANTQRKLEGRHHRHNSPK